MLMVRPWTSGDHVFVSYQNDDDRKTLLEINLTDALERGEKFVYFVEATPMDAVLGWFRDQRSDLEPILARGQFVIHSAERFAGVDGIIDSDRMVTELSQESDLAVRAGYTGLRVCTEMAWALYELSDSEHILEHEKRLGDLLAAGDLRGLRLVCQYDPRRLAARQLTPLRRAHAIALTAEQAQESLPLLRVYPLAGSTGLRFSGEIDRSNIVEFSAALESAIRDDQDFHLHLADVHYADVAAVRLLAQTASRLGNGCQLVLRSPGPLVRAILRIYGWDQLPSLRMLEGSR